MVRFVISQSDDDEWTVSMFRGVAEFRTVFSYMRAHDRALEFVEWQKSLLRDESFKVVEMETD